MNYSNKGNSEERFTSHTSHSDIGHRDNPERKEKRGFWDRGKDKDKERDRDKDRERERERDKEKERLYERDKDRGREKDRREGDGQGELTRMIGMKNSCSIYSLDPHCAYVVNQAF